MRQCLPAVSIRSWEQRSGGAVDGWDSFRAARVIIIRRVRGSRAKACYGAEGESAARPYGGIRQR